MVNSITVKTLDSPDLDYLSESEIECLDDSIGHFGELDFKELTDVSHGFAWANTAKDRTMSYKDMLREIEAEEEYISYVERCMADESCPF